MSASLRTQKSSDRTRTWLYNRGKLFAALVGAVVCVCTGGGNTILDSGSSQQHCGDSSCHEASSVGNTIGNTVGLATSASSITAAMNHVGGTTNQMHASAFRMQPLAGLEAKRKETVYLVWRAWGHGEHVRLFQTSQSDYEACYKKGYKFDTNCWDRFWGAYLISPDVAGAVNPDANAEVESTWVSFSGPSEKNYKPIGLHHHVCYWYGYQKTTWGWLGNTSNVWYYLGKFPLH